jgi:type VI secretion system protein
MIPAIRNLILKSLFLCMALGLVSCSNETLPELIIESFSIYTDPDANQNSATAVDLVIIYDPELVKILGQLSADKYFGASRQLLLDNPSLLDIWHWELVPGQIVQDFTPPQEEGPAFAAFVFANYLTPGDHRLRVSPEGIVKILLTRTDMKNLAVFDLHDSRIGTTTSNTAATTRLIGGESQVDLGLCQMKLGPTQDCGNPCKRMGPKMTMSPGLGMGCPPNQGMGCPPNQGMCAPPNYRPCQRQPIMTRPLGPPPAISRQPYPN